MTIAKEIDLQKFANVGCLHVTVNGELVTYDVSTPFVRDGWKYATNGWLCIRVKSNAKSTRFRTLPPAADLFKNFDPAACTEPWPDTPIIYDDNGYRCHVVGKHRIRGDIDELICALSNVRFNPSINDHKIPLPFIFDGGEGVIAGMRKRASA